MFRDFAMFDTLIRQKRLRSPIIFFCIMGFFAFDIDNCTNTTVIMLQTWII